MDTVAGRLYNTITDRVWDAAIAIATPVFDVAYLPCSFHIVLAVPGAAAAAAAAAAELVFQKPLAADSSLFYDHRCQRQTSQASCKLHRRALNEAAADAWSDWPEHAAGIQRALAWA